jgi:hypothetical protein
MYASIGGNAPLFGTGEKENNFQNEVRTMQQNVLREGRRYNRDLSRVPDANHF